MFRLQSLSIAQRMGLLIASSLLGIVVLSAFFLGSERTLVMEERQLGVRQTVETAHGIVALFYSQVAGGKMP